MGIFRRIRETHELCCTALQHHTVVSQILEAAGKHQ